MPFDPVPALSANVNTDNIIKVLMDAERLKKILADVAGGNKSVNDAADELTHFSFEAMGFITAACDTAFRR